jgi:hypothetical protein
MIFQMLQYPRTTFDFSSDTVLQLERCLQKGVSATKRFIDQLSLIRVCYLSSPHVQPVDLTLVVISSISLPAGGNNSTIDPAPAFFEVLRLHQGCYMMILYI